MKNIAMLFLVGLLVLGKSSNGQSNNCPVIFKFNGILNKEIKDSFELSIENSKDDSLTFVIEVLEKVKGDWLYSDELTTILNAKSIVKLSRPTKLPRFYKSGYIPIFNIQPSSKQTLVFKKRGSIKQKIIAKIRIHVLDSKECSLYYSPIFYFQYLKIK